MRAEVIFRRFRALRGVLAPQVCIILITMLAFIFIAECADVLHATFIIRIRYTLACRYLLATLQRMQRLWSLMGSYVKPTWTRTISRERVFFLPAYRLITREMVAADEE